jgi:maltose-binding protein MalE
MKVKTCITLLLSALALGQAAHAAQQLTVWEDIKKSDGIKTAIADFQKQFNVEVKVQEMPFAQQIDSGSKSVESGVFATSTGNGCSTAKDSGRKKTH